MYFYVIVIVNHDAETNGVNSERPPGGTQGLKTL